MKTINEAMKKLQESKRISLKEANETATFELDWANEDIANMENNQEKELTLIKNVENTLKTNSINAKVEVISLDGNDFGGWPIVKVTGPKEDLAKNIGLYYLDNNEDEIDYNEIYDTYLESKELKESRDKVAENIGKFIYDLGDSAWSYSGESKNNNGQKLYVVNKNGKETINHNELTKKVLEKFPELAVMLDAHNTIIFARRDQLNKIEKESLTESGDEEIELPSTEDGTAKKEIQDMLDRSWNRKYNIGIENEDKEIKTEYAKNTKYYRIHRGKETEVSQSMLVGKLQTLKTDIKLGVTLRYDYTIDDIDDMLEKVNQGESIKLFDAWYLNEEDYNGNKFESTEDNTAKKESKVVKESNDLEEKDATDMLREIEEWYKNYSSSNAFYEDLSNIIDYNKLINWYKSL